MKQLIPSMQSSRKLGITGNKGDILGAGGGIDVEVKTAYLLTSKKKLK